MDIWIPNMERITDRIEIHHGDCYGLLDGWPSDAALVTDPPYGIGYDYDGDANRSRIRQSAETRQRRTRTHGRMVHHDDRPFDPAPFLRFKTVLLWGADKFRLRLPEGGTMLAWNKNDGTGPADNFTDAEFAWTNREKVKRNALTLLWKGLCCVKTGEDNGVRYHPMLKPQGVCAWCLRVLALPVDALVIDPFMGSGSLGVACHRAGLRYLGVEIDPEHYATAKARLQRETAQGLLNMSNPTGHAPARSAAEGR